MRILPIACFGLALVTGVSSLVSSCLSERGPGSGPASASPGAIRLEVAPPAADGLGSLTHEQEVMKSSYCASCHPDIYAEHEQNTHGRAFTDEEVRLATGRFSQADCIICHTPRPVFETGIGQNPIRRHHNLEEGNTCMTCHWQEGRDYSRFTGGAECKTAFDPRVGSVEACASCHRNHGTPYQWEQSPNGKLADRLCIDCHMAEVERPVAVGGEVRSVRSHVFPASRNLAHLRKAYSYEAKIDGDHVVVTIKNKGAGHNFPTELKQRSVESLVVVRDANGVEIARSRMTFRDPYKRPYGLTLPVNTQIPSGESREHRVPLTVADGEVECELHYKLYYPIEDFHPDLARRLESRRLAFSAITPSTETVESEPEVRIVTPEGISPERAGPANLVDYARPPIDKVEVEIPQGDSPDDIRRLIDLFQFPVLSANVDARKRLIAIGKPAVPALVGALGSWDNKTYNQAMAVLEAIGEPAIRAVVDALDHPELYVRLHACELLGRTGAGAERDRARDRLIAALTRTNALDRSHAAAAIGELRVNEAIAELSRLVREDRDPDVVRAAGRSLAQLGATANVADLRAALTRFEWAETRRDLADALARLGDPTGIPVLLAGLDHPDDLVRESFFESFFAVTGVHLCYEPLAPRDERLEALGRLQGWWAKEGGADKLRHPTRVDPKTRAEVKKIAESYGGSDGSQPPADDAKLRERLLELGPVAIGGLTQIGLKFPPGFAQKRALICQVLGDIGDRNAVPALIATLRDPVVSVAAWACDSLAKIGDTSALPAVQRYHQRMLSLAARDGIPSSAGTPDSVIALAASAAYRLGDARVEPDLVGFLLSEDEFARATSVAALRTEYGAALEFDPAAPREARRAAVERWQADRR